MHLGGWIFLGVKRAMGEIVVGDRNGMWRNEDREEEDHRTAVAHRKRWSWSEVLEDGR